MYMKQIAAVISILTMMLSTKVSIETEHNKYVHVVLKEAFFDNHARNIVASTSVVGSDVVSQMSKKIYHQLRFFFSDNNRNRSGNLHQEHDFEFIKTIETKDHFNVRFSEMSRDHQKPKDSEQALAVNLQSFSPSKWVLSVHLYNGFTLNARVPETKRLQLVTPEQSWQTDDFVLQSGTANLYINDSISTFATLIAYVCRADRCKKITIPVTTQNR